MKTGLTKAEASQVSRAVADAEAGRATLPELAGALATAERAGATRTVGILRDHVRCMVPRPVRTSVLADLKSIALGILSGVITWRLLGRKD